MLRTLFFMTWSWAGDDNCRGDTRQPCIGPQDPCQLLSGPDWFYLKENPFVLSLVVRHLLFSLQLFQQELQLTMRNYPRIPYILLQPPPPPPPHRNKTKAKQEAALSVGETLWQSRQVLRALVVQIPSLAAMILQFPAVTKENLITNLTLSIIEGDEFGQLEGTEIYWGQVTVRYGASASQ